MLRKTLRRLTTNNHSFFGYYDLFAWNKSETRHLCLSVPFDDKIPCANDKADICYIEKGIIQKVAETRA